LQCTYQSFPNLGYNQISFTTPTAYTTISTYYFIFGLITNPSSALSSSEIGSFQVTFSGGNPAGSITSGLYVGYNPNLIYSATLTQANSNAKAGGSDTYTFKFQITSNIPLNGFIQFAFPSSSWVAAPSGIAAITSVSVYGTAAGSVTASFPSATVVNFGNIFSLSGLTASTSQYIIVTFTGIADPSTTGTTSSFVITTLDEALNAID
jgi:hypothetical protein